MSLQSVTFVGNLGGNPVLRFSENGKPRATFSVAITEGQGDNEKTHWVDVTAFNNLAENVSDSLAKGMRVVVVGRIDTYKREIDTTEGTKQVTTVKFIAQEVSPSLVFCRAKVTKVIREQAASGNGVGGRAGDGSAATPASGSGAASGGVSAQTEPAKADAAETAPAGVDAF
jgi:single-strand DNA-binding protein